MKLFSILITAIYLILNSCSNSTKTNLEDTTYPAKDSIKIAAIDTLMWQIDRQWKPDSNVQVMPFNQRDTLKYMELNGGKTSRTSSIFITDSTIIWIVFHVDNNELKLVRYREKIDKPTPSVKEVISYYDKGKIIFSKERGKTLGEGEGAGSFRRLEFVENARPPAQIISEYEHFWKASKEVVEKYKSANK